MPTFSQFVYNQRLNLPLPSAEEVSGRTYAVTGANTGLGFECAKHLVGLGAARVILAVRSLAKGEAARAAIEAAHPSSSGKTVLEVWELDLAKLDSVEAFAARLAGLDRLDALLNNAGVAIGYYEEAAEGGGMETSLLVNDLATMLLVLRALPVLRATASKFGVHTRMEVVVSGNVTRLEENVLEQPMKEANIFDALSKEESMNLNRYPLTKALQIFAVQHLAVLAPVADTGVIITAVNPGLCTTELTRNAPLRFKIIIGTMRLLFGRTAEMGSRTLLHGAVAGDDAHGKFLTECQPSSTYLPAWIEGEDAVSTQNRVWNDLLAKLAATGHKVDMKSVLQKA